MNTTKEIESASELTLSVIKAQTDLTVYANEAKQICFEAEDLEVTDDNQMQIAITFGGKAKAITKNIETQRKKTIEGASAFIETINKMCKILTEPLRLAEAATKNKINIYQIAVEAERQRQQEAARRAAQELQDKLRREAEEANRKAREEASRKAEEEARLRRASEAEIAAAKLAAQEKVIAQAVEPIVILPPVIPPKPVPRTESGTLAYQVRSWKHEVTDESLVPRHYMAIDEKKIREAIDMGLRELPGIRIYEEVETRFRNRK